MNKVLMLVNWKIRHCDQRPADLQPPDYFVNGEPYWFYRYFQDDWDVDVLDISSLPFIEHFEKETLHFYVLQALRSLPKLGEYDLVVSHGMQSGVVLSLLRRFINTKAMHVVFDIGSFTTPAAKSNIIAIVFLGSLIELGLFRSERIWTSFNRTMSILTKIVLPILPASVIPNEIGIRLLRRIRD